MKAENNNSNKVTLIGSYGGDKTHCLSAWTSTFEELGIEIPEEIEDRVDVIFEYVSKRKKKTPAQLLVMLATEGHHTPFEKSLIHFIVDTEIASHIHKLKHRIAVPINGESARYKELQEDKMYLPKDWGDISSSESLLGLFPKGTPWIKILETVSQITNACYHAALKDLEPGLGRKRAKESARFFKTYNSQIAADVTFNWRSFMHFQRLRNDKHAQLEIRELAQMMLEQVQAIPGNPFQYSLKAFGY